MNIQTSIRREFSDGLDRSAGSDLFDESRLGAAGELVPAWAAGVLERASR